MSCDYKPWKPYSITPLFSLVISVKRSNCYMVWGGDIVASSQRSSRSNVDLEIGCLLDLAMGMLSFSANGKELGTCYQVGVASGAVTLDLGLGIYGYVLNSFPLSSSSPIPLVSPCRLLAIRLANIGDCILYREKISLCIE